MKNVFTLFFAFLLVQTMSGQAVITAVFDGPLGGGTPKGVEIYFTENIADLSLMGISSANNGTGPTGTPEYVFPAGTGTQGQYIYMASEDPNFTAFFGFAPDYVDGTANINGDDAIELFYNGVVIDVFGDVNVDGTGMPWEHLDGWASRLPNTGPDGSTFVIGSWQFSGIDALDGETSNATAANPVPFKSYTGGTVTADHMVTVRSNEFVPAGLVVDVGDVVQWDNIEGFHNVNGSQATYPDNSEDFNNGAAAPATWTYQFTFNNPGYNNYQCDPHVGLGMVGTVMVREEGDHYVDVQNNFFTPEDITIELGETVVWTNVSGNHNVNGTTATFPGNPESFGNSVGLNWTYAHTFTVPGVYDYQCDPHASLNMVGTVTVQSPYPTRDITTIKQIDANGNAVYLDSLAAITGIVHGPNYRAGLTGVEFYLLDDNNNGVYVRTTSDNTGYTVAEGDMLTVSGEVGQFNGLIQFAPDVINVISSGNAILTPDLEMEPSEATEGSFIRINDLTLVDTAQWPGPDNNANVQALSGPDTIVIRIDRDIAFDIAAPLSQFDVIGLGGQFDNIEPYTEGYQILPRSDADILDGSATKDITEIGLNAAYPNPTTDLFFIEGETEIREVTVYNANGRLMRIQNFDALKVSIDLQSFPQGMYYIKVQTAQGIAGTQVMKK